MNLRGPAQALALNIVGYQFPDAHDPHRAFQLAHDRRCVGLVAAPTTPGFTEPNLALSVERGAAEDGATLHIGLDQEFRPPWSTDRRPHELTFP